MGFLSGLARPAFSGVDGFLAALRDKLERDRLRAAQAIAPGDPSAAMEIRARSAAIDAQRAEAKERARRKRMFGQEEMPGRSGLEVPPTMGARAAFAHSPDAVSSGVSFAYPGPDRSAMRLVAAQEGFERQQDRRLAEERARATGRDPDQVYREMRGLGRQEAPAAPVPETRRPSVVPPVPGASGPSRTVPPAASSQAPVPASNAPAPWRSGGRWDATEVERRAGNAMRLYDQFVAGGMHPYEAAGWAANAAGESDSNYRSNEPGGQGYGLFQVTHPARRRAFQRRYGHPIEQSTEAEQLDFRQWEIDNTFRHVPRHFRSARSPGDYAEVITRYYEIPANPDEDSADRANIAEAIRARDLERQRAGQRR